MEQLEQVREMASRVISPVLIAKSVGLSDIEFKILCQDEAHPLYQYYHEGFIQAKIELHEAIIKSAMNGSNPSQLELKKLIQESENFISNV